MLVTSFYIFYLYILSISLVENPVDGYEGYIPSQTQYNLTKTPVIVIVYHNYNYRGFTPAQPDQNCICH